MESDENGIHSCRAEKSVVTVIILLVSAKGALHHKKPARCKSEQLLFDEVLSKVE